MNFKMKALVAAAVAVMSISGAANAALTPAGDSSSLVLTVLDTSRNVSAAFDLGFDYQGFAVGGAQSTSSFSWNLTLGNYADAWSQFLNGADLGKIQWGVLAGDNVGPVGQSGSKGFITTYNTTLNGNTPSSGILYNQFGSPLVQLSAYVNENNKLGNHGSVADGASVANSGSAYAGTLYLDSKFFKVGPVALSGLGTEQGVVQYLNTAGAINRGTVNIYKDATFSLGADGILRYTVAAVPEPETYALLLAGLGLVGAAARRRKSA